MAEAYDPFATGSTLATEWFAGRADVLQTINRALRDGTRFLAVTGPRGIGKSSITSALKRNPLARVMNVEILWNARKIALAENPHDAIAADVAEELGFEELAEGPVANMTLDRLLDETVPSVTRDGKRLVIVLDEVNILRNDALATFASRLTSRGDGPLWIFIISEPWSGANRAVPAGFAELRLRPFGRRDVMRILRGFARRGQFAFTRGAREDIWRETNGYPLFVQTLLSALYERRRDASDMRSPVTRREVREVASAIPLTDAERIHAAVDELDPYVRRVLDTLSRADQNGETPERITERFRAEWPRWDDVTPSTLERLRANGIVEESGGRWRIPIGMLVRWLANAHRNDVARSRYPSTIEIQARLQETYRSEHTKDAAELAPVFREIVAHDPQLVGARLSLVRHLLKASPADNATEAHEHLARLAADRVVQEDPMLLAELRTLVSKLESASIHA